MEMRRGGRKRPTLFDVLFNPPTLIQWSNRSEVELFHVVFSLMCPNVQSFT